MVNVKIKMETGCEDLIPKKAHKTDAAFDLKSAEDVEVPMGVPTMVFAGFYMQLPPNHEAQVRPRSGLASKNAVTVLNSPGTIDSGYRGKVCVIIYIPENNTGNIYCKKDDDPNKGKNTFTIKRGDRIAQMVINELPEVELLLVNDLDDSDRGEGGFGHTGVKGDNDKIQA